jgi:Tfp pilus assembly protein PilF
MKRMVLSGVFAVLSIVLLAGCEEAKEVGAESAIMAPAGSKGREQNDDGVGHYRQGHWDVAEGHFRKAIQADANLAEAHFNLALALDKMDKHEDAKAEFQKALELAPTRVAIKDSPVLKKHLGM